MSLELLKIPKQIISSMNDIGLVEPSQLLTKAFSRLMGGQDLVLNGPDGSGKTTFLVISVLSKLKFPFEEAPRALIMVPTIEKGQALESMFRDLGANMELRVQGMYANVDIEYQREMLREGLDVVIGTPDRILALYIRSGINLTKLKLFLIDDVEAIIKQNQSVIIKNITDNLNKCQFVINATESSEKLNKLGGYFLINPTNINI